MKTWTRWWVTKLTLIIKSITCRLLQILLGFQTFQVDLFQIFGDEQNISKRYLVYSTNRTTDKQFKMIVTKSTTFKAIASRCVTNRTTCAHSHEDCYNIGHLLSNISRSLVTNQHARVGNIINRYRMLQRSLLSNIWPTYVTFALLSDISWRPLLHRASTFKHFKKFGYKSAC